MSRCVICHRRKWPWTRIVIWHGAASDGASVAVHTRCGTIALQEFLRGAATSGTPHALHHPRNPDVDFLVTAAVTMGWLKPWVDSDGNQMVTVSMEPAYLPAHPDGWQGTR